MFSQILDKKIQLIGALTLFSGIAGYFLYKKHKASTSTEVAKPKKLQLNGLEPTFETLHSEKCYEQHHEQKWSSFYSEYYFDKNLQIRKVLDHLDEEGISVETIFKYSPLIAVNEFKQFTKEIRNRRRLIRTVNQDQYIKLILDYEQEIELLLERSRQEIVYECEIDPEEFQNMKTVFEATEDLTALVRDARKHLKDLAFRNKRKICKTVLAKIINQEVSFIKSKLYDRLQRKLQDDYNQSQDEILKVIQALIDDIVYEKYGYEREEIESALSNQWSVELSKEIKELKKMRADLESDIGNITLISQESDNESEDGKATKSHEMTRSGANSLFNDDDQEEYVD